MPNQTDSFQRIEALKAEIATLEQAAIQELIDRRDALRRDLAAIDQQIAELTGKPAAEKSMRKRAQQAARRSPDLQELKELLANAPEKTLSIRKEGFDLANIKALANANPQLFKLGGKGPWPTVTLLK